MLLGCAGQREGGDSPKQVVGEIWEQLRASYVERDALKRTASQAEAQITHLQLRTASLSPCSGDCAHPAQALVNPHLWCFSAAKLLQLYHRTSCSKWQIVFFWFMFMFISPQFISPPYPEGVSLSALHFLFGGAQLRSEVNWFNAVFLVFNPSLHSLRLDTETLCQSPTSLLRFRREPQQGFRCSCRCDGGGGGYCTRRSALSSAGKAPPPQHQRRQPQQSSGCVAPRRRLGPRAQL